MFYCGFIEVCTKKERKERAMGIGEGKEMSYGKGYSKRFVFKLKSRRFSKIFHMIS